MITLKQTLTSQKEHYRFIEDLYISAFPKEERRELYLQREYTDHNPLFYNNIILSGNTPAGFISYWDFNDFYYIEHFAISPAQRNGGFGHEILSALSQKLNAPVVLEVEKPTEEFSIRRINFYKRLGYVLWENEYRQPPYRKGDGYLPMHLMVWGKLEPEKDFERIKNKLYKEVYKVEEQL